MRSRVCLWAVALLFALAAGVVEVGGAMAEPAPTAGLRAGAATVKITPSLNRPVYIAGYASNRVADRVQDDLWIRVLVLDDGKTRMAVVACDLIGLSNYRVRELRRAVRGVPAENVLITCTHVHSGPDTLGLWGPVPFVSGVDPLYQQRLADRLAAAVDAAVRDLRPVRVEAGRVRVPDGFVHNSREPLQDTDLTTLRFITPAGVTVSSVIHYGGHPEVNKSTSLTSDFVHYVREMAEQKFGGVALFLNGALGGMVTPKIEEHTFPEMERVGRGVGRSAVAALTEARPIPVSEVRLSRRDVALPMANEKFRQAVQGRLLDVPAEQAAEFRTEVWRVDLGPVTWITIPGEILPRPALDLKQLMPGAFPMVVALGNDEIGYILDPADFTRDLYKYEASMSVGPETWPRLFAAAKELLR